MPDVPDTEATLRALKAAGHPVRLEILGEATRSGSVRASFVEGLSGGAMRGGTPGYHLSALVGAGLLKRVARGEYHATKAGELINRLAEILSDAQPHRASSEEPTLVNVTVEPKDSFVDEMLPLGGELVAVLTRSTRGGRTGEALVRFVRVRPR